MKAKKTAAPVAPKKAPPPKKATAPIAASKPLARKTEPKPTAPAAPSAPSATPPVTLIAVAKAGNKVFLAGSFNDWSPTALEMVDAKNDGTFTATLTLPAGTYEYKFVVDGAWLTDPAAKKTSADGYGSLNSVLVV